MEPDVSIETLSMVRIAVVPVGDVPHLLLREYYSMFEELEKIPLSAISSFYTEHQKSPFAHQPWDSGALRFKFILGGGPPSPWEDFQSNRKTLALIGICHCPSSPNLDSSLDLFESTCRSFPSALVQRCFAFSPGDSQLDDAEEKSDKLRIFPPSDKQSQEVHLQTMMHEIGASLLMEFERWVLKAESVGTILKTPLDSQASLSSEEVIKSKKRRLGRAQKTIGDYCLLAGSPVDANAHYSTALELARLTGDLFWYAGALEGTVCALLIDQTEKTDSIMEDEVRYRYNSAISHYRKSFMQESTQRVSPVSFELEATLRVARFFCGRGGVKDVVDLLTSAADGGKSLIDASDRLILFVEVARLFGSIGYHRKAAFFSRQVAQLYLQQDHRLAAISAMQVLTLTTKAYHIQSKTSQSLTNESEVGNSDNGKVNHQSIVSLFESQWSSLQMVVLREILLSAIRAGDPLTTWSAAARLIRSYYPLITPSGQSALATALSNASDRLPPGTHCADTALPFVRLYSLPSHSSDIIKRTPGRGDWWGGSAPSGPFIYTPFSKGETGDSSKQEVVWVVGEPVQVLVELANPCAFELKVESIRLLSRQDNLDAFPISVTLPPSSSKIVSLSGIPTSPGSITLPGCVVQCFGVVTEHVFRDVEYLLLGAAQGLVLSDPFRSCGSSKIKSIAVPSISVVAALPLVVSHIEGGDGAIVLYEGEIKVVFITLANAGSVAVHEAHISLSGKNQDSVVSLPQEALNSSLPLQPGAQVTLPITLKAWQLSGLDGDKHSGRQLQLKDANSPSLVLHYGGPSTTNGRRLVVPLHICVLQGLSFVKGRMLAMEIPSRVGESSPISESQTENPAKSEEGSWGLRFMELEMSNPTDVVFEVTVAVEDDQSLPKTRIDRDHSSRVLIPLNHFKLPVLDGYTKAELAGSIKSLISKIKVRWHSGRNSSGELNIKEAIQSALRASVLDVLLPEPLSFGFKLVEKACVVAHELSRMEVVVRNNTKEAIRLSLSIGCRDVAGENCVEGDDATVLWGGSLNGMPVEVPPVGQKKHTFEMYFRVPGEYTLLAAAVIDQPTDVLRSRATATSPNDAIYCRGPPFHLNVLSHLHF